LRPSKVKLAIEQLQQEIQHRPTAPGSAEPNIT
jgi:hypothetical protein